MTHLNAPTCFHGGSFWEDVGASFERLGTSRVINADVLDAWFPPAPEVCSALSENLPWICRTSPPTHAEGLESEVETQRGLPRGSVLAGAGSSSLIFLAMRGWLTSTSKVLLLEPTYGEYSHVADLIGCSIDRFLLHWEDGFEIALDGWTEKVLSGNYDLVVLVNPNNPTGRFLPRARLATILMSIPMRTRLLIDEAYIDYAGDESCEKLAAKAPNVFVLKSLSKGLALSGMRAAYLVGTDTEIAPLRRWNPPWSVSLPAQIAAIHALRQGDYYQARYAETADLRVGLADKLREIGWWTNDGVGNWVLAKPPSAPASDVVARARERGVHLRNAGLSAASLGDRFVRVAVKDRPEMERICEVLRTIRG